MYLDLINAENSYESAAIQLEKSLAVFRSFFNINNQCKIHVTIPQKPDSLFISIEEAIQRTKSNNPQIFENHQKLLEAEQEVDRTRKTSSFDARFSASIGFNQAGNTFKEAYQNLLRQDIINFSISLPLVDWGIRKGKVNMAKSQLKITQLTVEQDKEDLEQEINIIITDFNRQQQLIHKASEALEISIKSYNINKQRFIIGKSDINTLTLSLNRKISAQRNYLNVLGNYWLCYYKIRKLTLYDFEKKIDLWALFEKTIHN